MLRKELSDDEKFTAIYRFTFHFSKHGSYLDFNVAL